MVILKKSVTFANSNTRFMKKTIISLTFAIALGIQCALAVPAQKGAVKMKQPDGTTVTIRLHGDEYLHFNTTTDGYSVVKDAQNRYVYAELKDGQLTPTRFVAHDASERTSSEKAYLAGVNKYQTPKMTKAVSEEKSRELTRRAQARQAVVKRAPLYDYNNFRGLIILVEFSDKSFSREDYATIANDIANAEEYGGFSSQYPFTGSVHDYFNDISGGLFKPEFDVVGPVKVNRNQYYANGVKNAAQLINDAVKAADSKVNFKDYDRDNDGMVDMIYFIFAGYGSNYGGNDERYIWPHASSVYNPQTYDWVWKDGVRLGRYACSTELYGWEQQGYAIIDGIGTICHEFSHVLGLMDAYDTDYEESGGESHHPGEWDIMSGGSYHNYSRTPVGYSLYERYAVGFATPEVIDGVGSYTLQNVSTNTGLRLNTREKKEYFLLENRQKDKWNKYVPGHGMLVFRVDSTNTQVWTDNKVNAKPSHNYFELLRAGGSKSGDTDSDPFPGTKKVKTLNNQTTPANLKTWKGKESPFGLENIKETNGVITFDVIDVNVLTSVKMLETAEMHVGLSYKFEVECYPETAPCTLAWSSDNEAVATVDENGVVTAVGVGTANITVIANGNDALKATCQITVSELTEYANIGAVKTIEDGEFGKLLLADAQVLYVHDQDIYVRDFVGSIALVNTGLNVKANDVLNGFIAGKPSVANEIAQLLADEGVDNSANISVTEGDAAEPHVLAVDQVNKSYYSDLVTIAGAEMKSTTVEGLKGVFLMGDSVSIRVYNTFGLTKNQLTMPKSYAGKKFDVTGILLNTVSNGKILYELALVKSPEESQIINGILQTENDTQQRSIFTLDGRRVQNMTKPGFYIIRQGQEKRKVFVK